MIIAIIHALLFLIVLEGSVRQSRQYILFIPTKFFLYLLPNIYHRAGGGLVIGASVAFLSSIAGTQMGPQTLLVLNAGFLTLWYIECAITLTNAARGFIYFGRPKAESPKEKSFNTKDTINI